MTTTTAPAQSNQPTPSAPAGAGGAVQLPVAAGFLQGKTAEQIVLDIPHTDYESYLKPVNEIVADSGEWIRGIIHLDARKVDVIRAGGRFVEPVYGRPRRAQGVIIGGDVSKNQVFINAGAPMVVNLIDSQKTADFA